MCPDTGFSMVYPQENRTGTFFKKKLNHAFFFPESLWLGLHVRCHLEYSNAMQRVELLCKVTLDLRKLFTQINIIFT